VHLRLVEHARQAAITRALGSALASATIAAFSSRPKPRSLRTGSSTGTTRQSIRSAGTRRVAAAEVSIAAKSRWVSSTRAFSEPSLYLPAVTLPAQPVK